MATFLPLLLLVLNCVFTVLAFGPIPTKDFCVADLNSNANGYACKDPSKVTANDFYTAGVLAKPGNTSNITGAGVTFVTVDKIPGLYGQNVLVGRADYAPKGFNPPHIHPRAAEFILVLDGTLLAGFVSSYPSSAHFNKILVRGDTFVVPQGLLHYVYNVGKTNAAALFGFNSDEAGVAPITYSVFGSKPDLDAGFLAKSFQLDEKIIRELQAKF